MSAMGLLVLITLPPAWRLSEVVKGRSDARLHSEVRRGLTHK